MLIMPIVDFYATASDWIPTSSIPPVGLTFFLIASFCNGIVIEIGRKIRVPEQEEEGVETYSVLWGCKKAALIWWCVVTTTAVCASVAAREVGIFLPVAVVLGSISLALGVFVIFFIRQQKAKQAKLFELLAAIWTLCLYLSLGVLPGVLNHV